MGVLEKYLIESRYTVFTQGAHKTAKHNNPDVLKDVI